MGNEIVMTECIGSLIIDIDGQELSAEDREIIAHPLVGGIILFTRNYLDSSLLQELTTSIRRVRKQPLLIMVDQEGGRVQRFREDFTSLPSLSFFGELYSHSPDKALYLAQETGWLMAAEILQHGLDLSLAPVLDLKVGLNNAIGSRAFHSNPQIVTILARAYIAGVHEAGMAATGKHFPGHGSVDVDSHLATPTDTRPYSVLEGADLIPFTQLAEHDLQAILASHLLFPQVDEVPVGYSRYWLVDILRKKLHFKGAVFSDDLNMEGANISSYYPDRVKASLEAGCDFALLCNNRSAVIDTLDGLEAKRYQVEYSRWGALQAKQKRHRHTQRYQHACELISSLTTNRVE